MHNEFIFYIIYFCIVLFIFRYLLEKEIRCQIYELSPNHYHHHALSNEHMDHFLELEHSHSQNGMLLVDALQNVVKTGDEDRDLTVRYYGKQVTQFVQQHLLALQWEEFRNREMKDQDLYQGKKFREVDFLRGKKLVKQRNDLISRLSIFFAGCVVNSARGYY